VPRRWIPRNEKVVPPLFVANGITGVRDMGGDLDVLKVWRAEIAAGRLLGPRYHRGSYARWPRAR
jgi:hypothetical protein